MRAIGNVATRTAAISFRSGLNLDIPGDVPEPSRRVHPARIVTQNDLESGGNPGVRLPGVEDVVADDCTIQGNLPQGFSGGQLVEETGHVHAGFDADCTCHGVEREPMVQAQGGGPGGNVEGKGILGGTLAASNGESLRLQQFTFGRLQIQRWRSLSNGHGNVLRAVAETGPWSGGQCREVQRKFVNTAVAGLSREALCLQILDGQLAQTTSRAALIAQSS
mmetsp:Transcript_111471/g.279143  ORF Transcript_111471/g.279143 Transcript_111471/m.279143 type:complete len:221 (-) Transcript_111471:295-957(-)